MVKLITKLCDIRENFCENIVEENWINNLAVVGVSICNRIIAGLRPAINPRGCADWGVNKEGPCQKI